MCVCVYTSLDMHVYIYTLTPTHKLVFSNTLLPASCLGTSIQNLVPSRQQMLIQDLSCASSFLFVSSEG